MTELEYRLKEALENLTKEFSTRLDQHQQRLDIQCRDLWEARRKLADHQRRLDESEQHLMRLNSLYNSLKPLLEKLNSFLNAN